MPTCARRRGAGPGHSPAARGTPGVNVVLTAAAADDFAVRRPALFRAAYGGVFRSTDDGASWTAANNVLAGTAVVALAVSATSLFAGTSGGVFRSTDDGAS